MYRYYIRFLCLFTGGWSFGTQKFKDMSATRYTRQTFIYSAVPFLRTHNFDGLDVDWEYPKGNDDKKNFVLLLKGTPFAILLNVNKRFILIFPYPFLLNSVNYH